MRRLFLILGLILSISTSARAELYHGIDIDAVYENSDWSSKEKIKEIIDDYTLLLQYQKEQILCHQNSEKLSCLNNLAKNIITNFYVGNIKDNLDNYQEYVKATFAAYGIVYCLNKYKIPSGSMCNQENNANTCDVIDRYINELLTPVEQHLLNYSFINMYKN